jgi:hypothetical protein
MNSKKSLTIITALLGLVLTTGAAASAAKPNITSSPQGGLTIWGANANAVKFVPWNSVVGLKAADSIFPNQGNGKCAFNIKYQEREVNNVSVGAFKNKILSDGNVRSIQGTALHAGEAKGIHTQAYLDPGSHLLKLVLDANGNVTESNEGDNTFTIRYRLLGSCP